MKKILIILSIIIVILAGIYAFLSNKKPVEAPEIPPQTEQIVPVKPAPVQAEPQAETPKLLDENDIPKSDIKVPEIG